MEINKELLNPTLSDGGISTVEPEELGVGRHMDVSLDDDGLELSPLAEVFVFVPHTIEEVKAHFESLSDLDLVVATFNKIVEYIREGKRAFEIYLVTQYFRTAYNRIAHDRIKVKCHHHFVRVDDDTGWGRRDVGVRNIYSRPDFKIDRDVSELKLNNFFLVPVGSFRATEKVTVRDWTPKRGRDWIMTRAAKLRQTLPQSRKYAVLCNSKAHFLLVCSHDNVHSRVLADAISGAEVYAGCMNDTSVKKPSVVQLSDYVHNVLPKPKVRRSLIVAGWPVDCVADLVNLEWFFKKDKPIFRAALHYLETGEGDITHIRSSLDNMAQRHKIAPLKLKHGAIVEKIEDLDVYKDLLGPVYAIAKRYFDRDGAVDKQRLEKQLSRFYNKQQGGVSSTLVNSTSSVSSESVAAMQSWLEANNVVEFARVSALLLALFEQRTWKGVVLVLSQYILGSDRDWFVKIVDLLNSDIFVQQGSVVDQQNVELSAWDFSLITANDFGYKLWELITTTLGGLIGDSIIDPKWKEQTKIGLIETGNALRREVAKLSIKKAAEAVLDYVHRFVSRIKRCVELRSWKPLFEQSDPILWKQKAVAIRTYSSELQVNTGMPFDIDRFEKLRSSGLIPSEWTQPFTTQGFADEVDVLVAEGERWKQLLGSSTLGRDVSSEMLHLNAYQEANSISYGLMATRMQPFGIVLSGVAGTGKSNLSDDIYKVIGRANNYTIDPTGVYNWQTKVNFQDGLGLLQWCIKMDDIDQSVAVPTPAVETYVETVIRVINNTALPIEQSKVELKGKVGAKPLLVLFTTNFKPARLQSQTLAPDAYYRRFPVWIEVAAHKNYALASGQLDPVKASSSVNGEVYEFKVYEHNPGTSNKDFPYVEVWDNGNRFTRSRLFQYLVARFCQHKHLQLEMLTRLSAKDYCPLCFASLRVDGTGCSCHQQGANFASLLIGFGLLGLAYSMRRFGAVVEQSFSQDGVIGSAAVRIRDASADVSALISRTELTVEAFKRRYDLFMSFLPSKKFVACIGVVTLSVYSLLRSYQCAKQGRENNAVPGFVPTGWIRAPIDTSKGLPLQFSTWTENELIQQIQDNLVRVKGRVITYASCVGHNLLLIPAHLVAADRQNIDTEIVEVYQNGINHKVGISAFTYTRIGYDVGLLKVAGLALKSGLISKFWYERDLQLSQFDAIKLVLLDRVLDGGNSGGLMSLPEQGEVIKCVVDSQDGDCGGLYIAQLPSGWKIIGMHFQLATRLISSSLACGMVVSQAAIITGSTRLAAIPQGLKVPLLQTGKDPALQSFGVLPAKSELAAAISCYGVEANVIGTAAVHVHGATMKTKVHPTLFADDFRDLEIAWCGVAQYWVPPDFKGRMVDDKWLSPYINSLTPLHRGPRRMEYYWLALMDYLMPLPYLDNHGYSEISVNEAITGIIGSTIQSVDLKTSVGPPFNARKEYFIKVVDRVAHLDPNVYKTYDEMLQVLNEGLLPVPVAIGTLKDEPIKYTKNAELRARVFNCLPFGFNLLSKCKLAGVGAYLRSNAITFESMVGIDMTSIECNRVVSILRRHPERIIELDIKNQDKSEDGDSLDMVALVFYAIARTIGTNAENAYAIIQAVRNTVLIYKNDFFSLGCTNVSGGDKTVEINSVDNSLKHRYFYYRMKYPHGLPLKLYEEVCTYQRKFFEVGGLVQKLYPNDWVAINLTFRRDCSLVTYGDDSLLSVASSCDFYDPQMIPELGLECGMVYTDGQKTSNICWHSLDDVRFLKRKFVLDERLGCFVGQISRETLAKMLVIAKGSTMSVRDHAAEILSQVLRELTYFGEQEYNIFRDRFISVAEKYGLQENHHLRLPAYKERLEEVRRGEGATWDPYSRENVEGQNLEWKVQKELN